MTMLPVGYSRLKLLFVDDALPTRILLREILRNTGLQHISIVSDAFAAFAEIKADPPDLVFTDWQMPDRSGLDLIRDIREAPESPNPLLPVILLTAKDDHEHVVRGLEAGATGYLIKPITVGRIVERITDAVTKPRAFLVSPGHIALQLQPSVSAPAGGVIIPPDQLLAAKVKGDRVAFAQALRLRAAAIAQVRRIFMRGASVAGGKPLAAAEHQPVAG